MTVLEKAASFQAPFFPPFGGLSFLQYVQRWLEVVASMFRWWPLCGCLENLLVAQGPLRDLREFSSLASGPGTPMICVLLTHPTAWEIGFEGRGWN